MMVGEASRCRNINTATAQGGEKLLGPPDPGNIVGYEYEEDEQPLVLQNIWMFQREIPGRELHYSLQLPAGWEYKASWINYAETKPAEGGNNQREWVVNDVKAIRAEAEMPPIEGMPKRTSGLIRIGEAESS